MMVTGKVFVETLQTFFLFDGFHDNIKLTKNTFTM